MSQKRGNILVIVLAVLLLVSTFAAGYFFWQIQQKSFTAQPTTQESQQSGFSKTAPTATPSQKSMIVGTPYFGKSLQSGAYQAVNLADGSAKDFIPAGYKIVSNNMYEQFPEYLILEKDKRLYSYQLENKLTDDIFGNTLPAMAKDEGAVVSPSITEKAKFFITINKTGSANAMGLEPILGSRYYFFDASTNQLLGTNGKGFNDYQHCFQYDSKNSRFFVWPCGEGIGSTLPLSITDLNGQNKREVVPTSEISSRAGVHYNNGQFVISSDPHQARELINLDANSLRKDNFVFTDNVVSQIQDFSSYSAVVSKADNTIVVGESSNILLLKFDLSNKITEAKYIPDRDVYANFVFVFNGKLYYQAKDAIRVINLGSGQVEHSWPSPYGGEVTLLAL